MHSNTVLRDNELVARLMATNKPAWSDVREFLGPQNCRAVAVWTREDFDRLISGFVMDCPARRCWIHLRDSLPP